MNEYEVFFSAKVHTTSVANSFIILYATVYNNIKWSKLNTRDLFLEAHMLYLYRYNHNHETTAPMPQFCNKFLDTVYPHRHDRLSM